MKTITIIGAEDYQKSNALVFGSYDLVVEGSERMSVSDGYHTMDELYDHKIALWISLTHAICMLDFKNHEQNSVWRSQTHSDGTVMLGWFVLGVGKDKGDQITYHLPMSKWEETEYAETLEKAPEFDGHTSNDVLKRLEFL